MAAVDRLSNLPDRVLHRILSLLPSIDESARTSVLARRWRNLWSSNDVLHFSFSAAFLTSAKNDDAAIAHRVISVVDECLLRASAPAFVSLKLPVVRAPTFPSVLSRWLRFATNHRAAEIILHTVVCRGRDMEIPLAIFDCRDLCSLKVDNCVFPSIPARVLADEHRCFTALKTLFLFGVTIAGKSLDALLSLCPTIERLSMSSCEVSGGITILSSTLRFFASYETNDDTIRVEIVSAPRLQHLVYCGAMENLVFEAGVLPKLEEATILFTSRWPFEDRRSWRRFASSIAHVKTLCINCWFFQFALDRDRSSGAQDPIFKNLTELHSWPVFQRFPGGLLKGEQFTSASLLALFSAVRNCPLIEQLCVHLNYYDEEGERQDSQMNWLCRKAMSDHLGWGLSDDDEPYREREWVDPLEEFEHDGYALPHLKMLKVSEYSGNKLEQRLVEFVLQKAVNLRSAIIYYVPEVAEELGKMRRLLNKFPKASADARMSMVELPFEPCSKDKFMLWLRFYSVDF